MKNDSIVSKTEIVGDVISRQAALNALGERPTVWTDDDDYALGERNQYDMDRLAIETVPSAQPDKWEDTVYRKAVQMLLAYFVPEERYAEAVDGLRRLPSAQPGWIPTSERLPERYDNYLITTKDEDTDIGTFHPEFKQWSICDADGFRLTDGVLAWCELPKPWEGKKNE